MKEQAWIEARQKELTAQLDQLQANANAITGALQFIEALLAEDTTPLPVAPPPSE